MTLKGYGCNEDFQLALFIEPDYKREDVTFAIEGYTFSGFQSLGVTLNTEQVEKIHYKLSKYLESVNE